MRKTGKTTIEATPQAQDQWVAHVNEIISRTLMTSANSWYMSANIPGKPRAFLPYLGPEGVGGYRKKCDEVAAKGYEGFAIGIVGYGIGIEGVVRDVALTPLNPKQHRAANDRKHLLLAGPARTLRDVYLNFNWADTFVKKGGHIIGYAVLAFTYWRALEFKGNQRWVAWLLAMIYALTDEFHQSFVAGRHSTIWDVMLFDNLGALSSLWLVNRYRKQKRPEPGRPIVK